MKSRLLIIFILASFLLVFAISCGPTSCLCPSERDESRCSEPASNSERAATQPPSCMPFQSPLNEDNCGTTNKSSTTCDGKNNIITIQTSGSGAIATLTDFTCASSGDLITCSGPKKEPSTALNLRVCNLVIPPASANCSNFPNTFWNEDLRICLPVGSSCCPTGQEWSTSGGKCVNIVFGAGKATEQECGADYLFINGNCVLRSSLATCCSTINQKAPCCYTSCSSGYHLNPTTHCCEKVTVVNPCASVNCSECLKLGNCPKGCC
jgi:hypothetical protein